MHRFYLPPEQCKENTVFLTGREAHHAIRVLRVRRGERVTALDGAGLELLCEARDFDRDKVKLAVIERHLQPGPLAQITLLQAIPRGKIIESIIQKATELGVSRIVPLLSERVVTQAGDKDSARKAGKWQLVAVEGIKQCGSAWLPKVEAPLTPAQFLNRKEKFELPLVASLQPGSKHPREFFQSFQAKEGRLPKSICVWVGPEGDFSPAEVGQIQSGGALPISLGPRVLRVETAAVYCLSVINYEIN
jgi:16S rRNA (uracil1498-N3)-methyltransferase